MLTIGDSDNDLPDQSCSLISPEGSTIATGTRVEALTRIDPDMCVLITVILQGGPGAYGM